jgi:hypothetical protein
MKKGKKENSTAIHIFALGAIAFFLISILFILNIDRFLIVQQKRIPVVVKIGNYTGFNMSKNDTTLNLGTVKNGSSVERYLDIANSYSFAAKFEFSAEGDITPLLVYPEYVYLKPYESIRVPFKTEIIPNDLELGYYSGEIIVTVKKFTGKFEE